MFQNEFEEEQKYIIIFFFKFPGDSNQQTSPVCCVPVLHHDAVATVISLYCFLRHFKS